MHMLNAVSGATVDYPTSACTHLFCRRLKSGAQYWTEKTLSSCQQAARTCYVLASTQALPIVSNMGIPGCEQLSNVALSNGQLVTPTAAGLKTKKT